MMAVSDNANDAPITLVIPAYNRGDLLGETIDSALAQTVPFAEIIVVDDGSTDNTAAILSGYANRITIVSTRNQGVQRARNRGVATAKTECVALLDSDDLLEATFVETVAGWLSGHPEVDIVFSNFVTFDEQQISPDKFSLAPHGFFLGARSEGEFIHDIPELYRRILKFQLLFASALVFRKSFYERVGGYNPALRGVGSEDLEFVLRVICMGNVAVCRRVLARIRRHSGNDSGNKLRQVLGESLILEFSLSNHVGAQIYREDILVSLNQRRIDAFNLAFFAGNYRCVLELAGKLTQKPSGVKFWTKLILSKLLQFRDRFFAKQQ